MQRFWMLAALFAAVLVGISACSSDGGKQDDDSGKMSDNAPAENAAGDNGTGDDGSTDAETATFSVVNNTTWDIDEIYISPSDETNWGPDLLGDTVLKPGETAEIQLSAGKWDFKVVAADDSEHIYEDVMFEGGDEGTFTLTEEADTDGE